MKVYRWLLIVLEILVFLIFTLSIPSSYTGYKLGVSHGFSPGTEIWIASLISSITLLVISPITIYMIAKNKKYRWYLFWGSKLLLIMGFIVSGLVASSRV